MAECVKQHGKNWLCPEICKAFLSLHEMTLTAIKEGTDRPLATLHSFEVWHDGKLEAGEVSSSSTTSWGLLASYSSAMQWVVATLV